MGDAIAVGHALAGKRPGVVHMEDSEMSQNRKRAISCLKV